MTRKEYEELHRVAKDKLGHQLHVGDLVVGYAYSCSVEIYKVKKLCKKKALLVRALDNRWDTYIYPDRLIKIKEDGISEN